jgi:hypothetical protein
MILFHRQVRTTERYEIYPPDRSPVETGLEAATVIAHHRGLASGSITITFSIKQNQMDSIKKWNDRSKHSEFVFTLAATFNAEKRSSSDLGNSLCLSLLCLEVTDVKARVESSQSNDLRTLLPEFECSWPDTGTMPSCPYRVTRFIYHLKAV